MLSLRFPTGTPRAARSQCGETADLRRCPHTLALALLGGVRLRNSLLGTSNAHPKDPRTNGRHAGPIPRLCPDTPTAEPRPRSPWTRPQRSPASGHAQSGATPQEFSDTPTVEPRPGNPGHAHIKPPPTLKPLPQLSPSGTNPGTPVAPHTTPQVRPQGHAGLADTPLDQHSPRCLN